MPRFRPLPALPALLAGALLAATAPPITADVVVTPLEGAPIRGISLSAAAGRVSVTPADGPAVTLGADTLVDIVVLGPAKPPPPSARPFEILLADGTRLRGVLEEAPGAPGAVRIRSALFRRPTGDFQAPVEDLREIRRVEGRAVPGASRLVRVEGRDAIYQRNGARNEGFVEAFLATGLRIDRSPLEPREIAYDDLAAVFFDVKPAPEPAGLVAVARLVEGSAVLLRSDARIGGGLLEGTTVGGLAIEIPWEQVASLGFRGGRFVHLSDLTPAAVNRTPFFPLPEGPGSDSLLEFVCPVRMDKSPDGRPITLEHRRYEKGIGVRPRTELVYELDGAYREFRSVCGIDDEVLGNDYGRNGGSGSVVFSVFLDGKLAAETGVVTGGGKPEELKLDLRGVKRLALVVQRVPPSKMPAEAEDSPELDNAVWARPILIR
ncbi:MAG: NPCBM/NEW2 domain-containing protein [Planctomycetaceae bacterium]